MNKDLMNRELTTGLVWGGGMLAVALGAVAARKLGYVDGDTVTRVVIGANGLMMAWYGNRMPKTIVPGAQARRARRVAAWSLVLSGLVYAGLWALAPIPAAAWGGTLAIVAGMVVTFGYCLSLRSAPKAG
jgi:hypothetical protein